jgi:hypothetical protein
MRVDYPENLKLPFYKSPIMNPHLVQRHYAGYERIVVPKIKPWERVLEEIAPQTYKYKNYTIKIDAQPCRFITVNGKKVTGIHENFALALDEFWEKRDKLDELLA